MLKHTVLGTILHIMLKLICNIAQTGLCGLLLMQMDIHSLQLMFRVPYLGLHLYLTGQQIILHSMAIRGAAGVIIEPHKLRMSSHLMVAGINSGTRGAHTIAVLLLGHRKHWRSI